MPIFNGEKYLRSAIQSVLDQTFKNFELIIINDASTDKSLELIKSFADQRIVLINKEKNSGFIRNEGIEASRGEFVAFLDCDDIAHPDRLKREVEFLRKNPDYGLVGTGVRIIDENDQGTGVFWRESIASEKIPIRLIFGNCFALSSSMVRKNALPAQVFIKNFIPTEDFELWVRMLKTTKGANLSLTLTDYRQHSNNLSKQKRPAQQERIDRVITEELKELGASPSTEELAIHRQNYGFAGSPEETKKFMGAREAWLIKLCEANEKTGHFSKKIFNEVMGERFLTTAETNARLGLYAWGKFWHSPLSKKMARGEIVRRFLKFLIKCLLKKDSLR